MIDARRPNRIRIAAVAVGAIAVVGMLAGCIDGDPMPGPSSSSSATGTSKPTGTPTAGATSTPAPSATAAGPTPIDADCATLVPLPALYDLDPNLALLSDSAPTGALAIEAVAAGGVACTLVHTSNGSTIEIAVSSPGSAALASAIDAAGDPYDLGVSGADGYVSGSGLQAFTATHRYTAESSSQEVDLLALVIAIPIGVLG